MSDNLWETNEELEFDDDVYHEPNVYPTDVDLPFRVIHWETTIYAPVDEGFVRTDARQNKTFAKSLITVPVPEVRTKWCMKKYGPIKTKVPCGVDRRTTKHMFELVASYPTTVEQAIENRIKSCVATAAVATTSYISKGAAAAIASGGAAVAALAAGAVPVALGSFKVCVASTAIANLVKLNVQHRTERTNWG